MGRDATIAVGMAGWSYPDWNAIVYPRHIRDRLAFLAGYVDMIEINATFYRIPDARWACGWLRSVRDQSGFFFTAKLHRDFTHGQELRLPPVRPFLEGLEPLRLEGRWGGLLVQFRYDFCDTPRARDRLLAIRDACASLNPFFWEVRHSSWQTDEGLAFFKKIGGSVVAIDYPARTDGFTLDGPPSGMIAYMRLHGRNRMAWHDPLAGRDEVYDYLYNKEELEPLIARALRLGEKSGRVHVVANNHFQGKGLVNALEIKAALSGGRVRVPETLTVSYPHLQAIALPCDNQGCFW